MMRLLRRRTQGDDRGMSLVVVIAVTAIMATLVVAGTAMALNSQKHGHRTAAWDASLAAAYGGVEEYRSMLTANPDYWRYGNPSAPFTLSSGSSVAAPPTTNPAFATNVGGTWGTIASNGDGQAAHFRYEVDNSKYESLGVIRLRSTGTVGDDSRTVVASINQEGFIRYLYWSDYELSSLYASDPTCRNNNWNVALNRLNYAYEGRNSAQCPVIQFAVGDRINGPVYTNDQLVICGATFRDVVRSMSTSSPAFVTPAGCGAPNFAVPGSPEMPASKIEMPPTNAEMRQETRYDKGGKGCLYTGPTTIKFNSDGTMTVRSPWTRATQVAGDDSSVGREGSGCGSVAQLTSATGATVPVAEGTVVFVQDVPTAATNANYPVGGITAAKTTQVCGASNDSKNPVGYPVSGESAATGTYRCTAGDAFVSGVVRGHTTVAAESNVWVVADLTYKDRSSDLLGLVGQSSVTVWHPVTPSSTNLLANSDRKIDAAIASVNGTLTVQNYDKGVPVGVLKIYGAIAQRYRGPVGTGYSDGTRVSGYDKGYDYDARLQVLSPPKFLKSAITTFKVAQTAEVHAAFDSQGHVTG